MVEAETREETWELIITGCGTSHGNPPWGYPSLWSDDPRDLRRRSGAILQGPAGQVVLFDCGPDLMQQLRDPRRDWDGRSYPTACIRRCDAVLLTHTHADHTHGFNELRHLNRLMDGGSIPIYGRPAHIGEVERMFPYCFTPGPGAYEHDRPALHTEAVAPGEAFSLLDHNIVPVELDHGPSGTVTGYRCGPFAYCTDCKAIPAASMDLLAGVEVLVLDMLREKAHPTHMNWNEAKAVIKALRPRRTILVHMGYEVRYADWTGKLPPGVELAYDGLVVPFRWSESNDG